MLRLARLGISRHRQAAGDLAHLLDSRHALGNCDRSKGNQFNRTFRKSTPSPHFRFSIQSIDNNLVGQ